jgi:hypothetical protein
MKLSTPTALAAFALTFVFLSAPALANDEQHEACTRKGYNAQVNCILKKCGRLAPGSTAQLKCEEDYADLCEVTGQDVEKRCLGIR